ncbi:MAG: CBS domain-containing protein [Gemmatimonadetes bacterium]|jgi:CBS domain-containing protein|nr:CBS domain-containing protein [Gemmatimonadota bacterium]
MAVVRDLLARKGTDVVSIQPSATVLEAARLMNDRGVGGVVVVDETHSLIGIFTERDILRRVVAAGLPPETTRVADVFTRDIVTCSPDMNVEEIASIMTTRRVRHLPVVDAAGLRGVVTIGDLLAHRLSDQETTIQHLNSYVFDMR